MDNEKANSIYNEDYFECGSILGISGYINYSWMPELTIRMAHHLIQNLNIKRDETVLDYGCAKGFLVKALRLLDIQASGVDVSQYAISEAPHQVSQFCHHITGVDDESCYETNYDWLISKDVFEHIDEQDLNILLTKAQDSIRKMFVAIPLGKESAEGFVIPNYDQDITHITIKPLQWWKDLFTSNGWKISYVDYVFPGIKENWTAISPKGNAFFILENQNS